MMKDMDYPDDLLYVSSIYLSKFRNLKTFHLVIACLSSFNKNSLKDIMKEYSSVKSNEKAKKPRGKEFLDKFADTVLKPRARTPGGSELPRN